MTELRLQQFVRSEIGKPFEWGETNCLALALRAVDYLHGTTLHADHKHRMTSAKRAQAGTRKHGLAGVMRFLEKAGLVEVKPNFAQPGDILLGLTDDGQIAAHISLGTRCLSSTQDHGVEMIPVFAIKPITAAGWRAS